MTHITLLRHGQSEGNADAIHQGQRDYPLTARGREQAAALAARWQAEGRVFDRIVCSPSARARETAEILNQQWQLPISYSDDLLERAKGSLEGQPFTDTPKASRAITTIYQRWGGSGESEFLLASRAGRALQAILQSGSERVLVVSHGALLNAFVRNALNLPVQPGGAGAGFSHGNTAFSELRYDREHLRIDLLNANDQAHVDPDPPQSGDVQLTLVRHGESLGNVQHIMQGQMEFDLSERGHAQGRALAARLAKDAPYDALFSSPQSRAHQTAEHISAALGLPIDVQPAWIEVDNGDIAGLTIEQFRERFGPSETLADPFSPLGRSGESWWDLTIRVMEGIQAIMERGSGRYLIVSHGGTLRAIVRQLLGIMPQPHWHTPNFPFYNTNLSRLSFHYDRHRWVLTRHGDTAHLAGIGSTEE